MGNFSRNTFDPKKNYTSVRLQQGVPLVDADWNEMEDIRRNEVRQALRTFVGDAVTTADDGFRIAPLGNGGMNTLVLTAPSVADGSSVVVDPASTAAAALGFGGGNTVARRTGTGGARLTGSVSHPFALASGQTLVLRVNGGAPVTVTFVASGFGNMAAATATEVAAVVNAAIPGLASTGSGNDVAIGAGTCIASGWTVVNDRLLAYTAQPLYGNTALAAAWGVPVLPPLTMPPGVTRVDSVYLDVWEREVGEAEDPSIVNSQIGIETSVRLRREWVVRVAEGQAAPPAPAAGHVHYPLARLNRPVQVAIPVDQIVDQRATVRTLAGQNAEAARLDNAKVNRSGDTVTGNLVVQGRVGVGAGVSSPPLAPLHLAGGSVDVGSAAVDGDLRIGSATNFLKVGTGLAGAGADAGHTRVRASHRLTLGAGTADQVTMNGTRVDVGSAAATTTPLRVTATGTIAVQVEAAGDTTADKAGVVASVGGAAGTKYGVQAFVSGAAGYKCGVRASASGDTESKVGVYATAEGAQDWKTGVYAQATGGAGTQYGVQAQATGTDGYMYGVLGSAAGDLGTKYGGWFTASGADGPKTGIRAWVEGNAGTKTGLHARVDGALGTKAGLVAQVSGADGQKTGMEVSTTGEAGTKTGLLIYTEGAKDTKTGVEATVSGADGAKTGVSTSVFGDDGLKYGYRANVTGAREQKTGGDFRTSGEGGNKFGVSAYATGKNDAKYGLHGQAEGELGDKYGVAAYAFGAQGFKYAVYGNARGDAGTNYGVYGTASGSGAVNWAGYFQGNVHVNGTLSKTAGTFLIDHPLDPENRVLRHNFVESPEYLCLYRGRVALGKDGTATVPMPEYFKALTDEAEATVQLTPIGAKPFLASYEWNKAKDAFVIHGDAGAEVSWLVMADRDDPAIHLLRQPVEEDKEGSQFPAGEYLNPEAYPRRKPSRSRQAAALAARGVARETSVDVQPERLHEDVERAARVHAERMEADEKQYQELRAQQEEEEARRRDVLRAEEKRRRDDAETSGAEPGENGGGKKKKG